MKRKVISIAGKTFVISLPAAWCRKNNVKKGDELDVVENISKLSISTGSKTSQKICMKKEIDVTGCDPMITRILGALFKSGYDEFFVTFSTTKELVTIKAIVQQEFIGFEVIDEKPKKVHIKKVSAIQTDEFNSMLRRIFIILNTMANESLLALRNKDIILMESIIDMDKEINKLADFCRRIINKKGDSITDKVAPLYYIIEELEKIGDVYRDICKYGLHAQFKVSNNLNEAYIATNDFYNMFYRLFYNFNLAEISKFGKNYYVLLERIQKNSENAKQEESFILGYLQTIIENCFNMNGALMAYKL